MTPRWLLAVAGTCAALGCTPYIVKDNIPGPRGEPLVEIACASPDECMTFARETCKGDFEIATNSYTPSRQIDISSSADIMLVHCQNAPDGPPAAMHVAAPDAGP
jgi:hypothetical protein